MPRLPAHVKLPQFNLAVEDRLKYVSQVREYNSEAMKLFNSVGVLQCPHCLAMEQTRAVVPETNSDSAGVSDAGAATSDVSGDATAPASGAKVFKLASALLAHMDKCCPSLVPGSSNADIREAMEKMHVRVFIYLLFSFFNWVFTIALFLSLYLSLLPRSLTLSPLSILLR